MKSNYLKRVEVRLKQKYVGALKSDKPIESPDDAIELLKDELSTLDREVMIVVNLDVKNRPINYNIVSVGATDIAIIAPANVFKAAILSNAASVLVIHNHPSGDIQPSHNDDEVTSSIGEAGRILNINLYDSIIIGAGCDEYFSYRTNKPLILSGIIL